MKLLVNELRLSERRDVLKEILERAVPVTFQDVVVTFCTVTGWRNGQLVQNSDARKIYHQDDRRRALERDPDHDGRRRSARCSICTSRAAAAAGLRPAGAGRHREFLANRFGKYYDSHRRPVQQHDEWTTTIRRVDSA